MRISSSRTSGIEFGGGGGGSLWTGYDKGIWQGVQSSIFQPCRKSMRRGLCKIQSLRLALSCVILSPRYIDTGPVSTISRSGVSLVFKAPVQSGLWVPGEWTETETGPPSF